MKFDKYQVRSASYHWQQISRSVFKLNAYVLARYQSVIARVKPGSHKILDIGCGDGVLLSLIKNSNLYGVDLDQQSLNYANTKVKAKLIRASATKLPFRHNFFDVVLATEIIEHLSQPELMLSEIKRVLRPGGHLILSTPAKLGPVPEDKLHVKEFTLEELYSLLSRYFPSVKVIASHPLWLKKLYLFKLFKFNRYFFEPFRLLINFFVVFLNLNPFLLSSSKNTQLLAVCRL